MKIFCKGNHWEVVNGQVILNTPTGKDIDKARSIVEIIKAQVRLEIYDAIIDMKLTDNRKAITKAGIDNVALTIQNLCAEIALGKPNSVGVKANTAQVKPK